jgi:RNA polymerase-binding protein DksA
MSEKKTSKKKTKKTKKPTAKKSSAKKSTTKKSTAKKSAAKKSSAKKSTAKKSAAKKSSAKKSTAKKPAAKKSSAKESTAKKPAAKKSSAKKSTAKKPAAKKSSAKKSAAKKSSAKKSTAKKPAAKKSSAKKPVAKKPATKSKPSQASARINGITPGQRKELKEMLETRRAELLKSLRIDEATSDDDTQDRIIEEYEQASAHQNQAVSLRVRDKEAKLLKMINRALAKFETDEYGLCEGTEEPIGYRRLKLVPWARYSVAYKEQLEQDQIRKTARRAGR